MGGGFKSQYIQTAMLQSWSAMYNRDLSELIDLYLIDAKRKISQLHKALEHKNFEDLSACAKELRARSAEIGAIHFSHLCLMLEINIQEMRHAALPSLLEKLGQHFELIHQELIELRELQLT